MKRLILMINFFDWVLDRTLSPVLCVMIIGAFVTAGCASVNESQKSLNIGIHDGHPIQLNVTTIEPKIRVGNSLAIMTKNSNAVMSSGPIALPGMVGMPLGESMMDMMHADEIREGGKLMAHLDPSSSISSEITNVVETTLRAGLAAKGAKFGKEGDLSPLSINVKIEFGIFKEGYLIGSKAYRPTVALICFVPSQQNNELPLTFVVYADAAEVSSLRGSSNIKDLPGVEQNWPQLRLAGIDLARHLSESVVNVLTAEIPLPPNRWLEPMR